MATIFRRVVAKPTMIELFGKDKVPNLERSRSVNKKKLRFH